MVRIGLAGRVVQLVALSYYADTSFSIQIFRVPLLNIKKFLPGLGICLDPENFDDCVQTEGLNLFSSIDSVQA